VFWAHEHGPRGGDEIKPGRAWGKNYGLAEKFTYGVDLQVGAVISPHTEAGQALSKPFTGVDAFHSRPPAVALLSG